MTAVPLGQSTYRRRGARTAEVAFTNMILEKDPTNQIDGMVRYQRPGLAAFNTIGDGPIRGIFRKAGVLDSVYVIVSGQALYTLDANGGLTNLGSIPGFDLCIIDGLTDRVIIVSGAIAYSTDGATIVQVNMPDDVGVSSVTAISGYFILTVEDSQHAYWLAPGDVDPDALSFFSAESSSDNLVVSKKLLDELWLFGEQTTEIFQITSDPDLPFQPIGGRLYERGCANKDTVSTLDNTLFWVGNDLIAYRADTNPVRISDHSMEERLRDAGSDDLSGWSFALDGHSFYLLRTGDEGTFVFDIENPDWGRWKSYNQATWRARTGAQIAGDMVICGDDANGNLWQLDPTVSNDNGDPVERELTGGLAILGKPAKCNMFTLRMAAGWAAISAQAMIQMRYSDDGGNLWSSWLEMSLGAQAQYTAEIVWRQLGQMRAPGRLFTIRCTDDTIFRVSFARINEANAA